MTIEIFEKYLSKIDSDWSLFDLTDSEYSEWEEETKFYSGVLKCKCFGMRHKTTGKSHGIVR